MDKLERIILIITGEKSEIHCLTDNVEINNKEVIGICERMRNGSWVAFNLKSYLPYHLFHFVSDLYNQFPDLIDLGTVYEHIRKYELWVMEENERVMKERMNMLLERLKKAASRE